MRTVILLGSSGLTGSILLRYLLENPLYNKVIVINRKSISFQHPKLLEMITDFKEAPDMSEFGRIDAVFSCLGTTRRKTHDLKAYRNVEIGIPCLIAIAALRKDLKTFHYISGVDANASSRNFYLRIKGEAEDQLKKLKIPFLHLYRPSLLIGPRKEKRVIEKALSLVIPLFDKLLSGKTSRYKSMNVDDLAKAMIFHDIKAQQSAVQVHEYYSIMEGSK